MLVLIIEDLHEPKMMPLDAMAHGWLVNDMHSPVMTDVAKFITLFGDSIAIGIVALLTIGLTRNKKVAAVVVLNLVLVVALNFLLKNIIQRPRPVGYRLISESGYSFPSGHSMLSMAMYGMAIYLIYRYVGQVSLKWLGVIGLGLLIVLIGASRVYLGVHYASDVLAGFLITLAYLVIYLYVAGRYLPNKLHTKSH